MWFYYLLLVLDHLFPYFIFNRQNFSGDQNSNSLIAVSPINGKEVKQMELSMRQKMRNLRSIHAEGNTTLSKLMEQKYENTRKIIVLISCCETRLD